MGVHISQVWVLTHRAKRGNKSQSVRKSQNLPKYLVTWQKLPNKIMKYKPPTNLRVLLATLGQQNDAAHGIRYNIYWPAPI